MHEAYCGVYRNDDEISEVRPPALESPATLAAVRDESAADLVAGDALRIFAEAWGPSAGPRLPDLRGSAADIARLARIDFARGRAVTAAEAMPHYVRDRVALTIDERRQKVNG